MKILILCLAMLLTDVQIRANAELELRRRDEEKFKTYESKLEYYRTDPFAYMIERLDVKPETLDWELLPEYKSHTWDGTVNPLMKILEGLAQSKWVGVESGKGTGKTFLAACIVYWFLECWENSLVVTTAPKKDQLTLHVWKEIGRLHKKFGRGFLDTLLLRMKKDEQGKKSYEWAAVGYVAGVEAGEVEKSAKKAQGFHAEHMLILFEETPGINQSIITAFQDTCSSPHNLILALGNPDNQFDNLHKFCALPNLEHIRISALDHPNVVTGNANLIPGATSREDIERKTARYGSVENPLYSSGIRGISPGQSQSSLIKLEWCYAAAEKGKQFYDANGKMDERLIVGDPALGVDVANSESGDKAAISRGKGAVLLGVEDFHCPDANQLGKKKVYQLYKSYDIHPKKIGVDSVGVGAGTVNALKEMGLKVSALSGAESPVRVRNQFEEFNNLRSQMHWQMREDLRNGEIVLPYDEELFADLVTPEWMTKNGKIVIESKEEIKKRLGRSPNKGDAAIYWNWVRKKRKPDTVEFLT